MEHNFSPATENVVKNYTLTAIASFSIVFCLFVIMSTVKGSFHPPVSHHTASHDTHKPSDAKHDNHATPAKADDHKTGH